MIEGPCNCVNKILSIASDGKISEVKDLVKMPNFSWDATDSKSLLYLSAVSEEKPQIKGMMD